MNGTTRNKGANATKKSTIFHTPPVGILFQPSHTVSLKKNKGRTTRSSHLDKRTRRTDEGAALPTPNDADAPRPAGHPGVELEARPAARRAADVAAAEVRVANPLADAAAGE